MSLTHLKTATKPELGTMAFGAVLKGKTLNEFLESIKTYPIELQKYAEARYNLHYKKFKNKTPSYTRVGILTPEEVFKNMGKVVRMFGVKVNFDSVRYRVYYKKGLVCVACGLDGHYFAVEKSNGQPEAKRYHLNLYHKSAEGREVMLTVDHILPESKGGKRNVANLQPMCVCCNILKGNKNV